MNATCTTGKGRQPTEGVLSRSFPLWVTGAQSHWKTLRHMRLRIIWGVKELRYSLVKDIIPSGRVMGHVLGLEYTEIRDASRIWVGSGGSASSHLLQFRPDQESCCQTNDAMNSERKKNQIWKSMGNANHNEEWIWAWSPKSGHTPNIYWVNNICQLFYVSVLTHELDLHKNSPRYF